MADVEDPDINGRALAWIGIAIVCAILIAAAGAWYLWNTWDPSRPVDGPNTDMDFRITAPVLDSAPQVSLRAYNAEKDRLLNSWEWVDRKAGVARIPIGEAMQLAVQHAAAAQNMKAGKP